MNESIIKISIDALNNSSSLMQNPPLVDTHIASASIPYIDPNWFYSSLAQSAAAIVGLMGAFIVTKLINEKGFFENIQRDIEEYKHKVQSITKDIEPKKEWLENVDLIKNTQLVRKFLNSLLEDIDPDNPLNVGELYKLAISEEAYRNLNKAVLEIEYNAEYLEKVKKYRNSESQLPDLLYTDFSIFVSISDELKYGQYENEIKNQQNEILVYEVLLKDKKNRLKDNKEILNLRGYILVLLIFSIIGVFQPLYVMLSDYDTMMELRFQTIVFIFIGWLIILGFFYREVLIYQKSQKN